MPLGYKLLVKLIGLLQKEETYCKKKWWTMLEEEDQTKDNVVEEGYIIM